MHANRFNLGLVSAALSADVRAAIKESRSGLIKGLLFDAYSSSLDFPELSATGRRELTHLLSSNQIQMIGLRVDLGATGFKPDADIDRAIRSIERAMKSAADLHSPLVTVDLGPLPVIHEPAPSRPKVTAEQAGLIILPTFAAAPAPEISNRPTPQNVDPNFVASVDAAMLELGAYADRYSCTVAFRSELSPFAGLSRAIRSAACPWFGIDLDPVDILRDEWSADEVFSRLGPLIRHVRARDAVKGAGQRTQPAIVGQGSVNWEETIAMLDDAGFNGWITLDPSELPDRPAAIQAGLKTLKSIK